MKKQYPIGVELNENDLEAIKKLYSVRWWAEISNWKEKDCEGCLWRVTIPNEKNHIISELGINLSDTIENVLQQLGDI